SSPGRRGWCSSDSPPRGDGGPGRGSRALGGAREPARARARRVRRRLPRGACARRPSGGAGAARRRNPDPDLDQSCPRATGAGPRSAGGVVRGADALHLHRLRRLRRPLPARRRPSRRDAGRGDEPDRARPVDRLPRRRRDPLSRCLGADDDLRLPAPHARARPGRGPARRTPVPGPDARGDLLPAGDVRAALDPQRIAAIRDGRGPLARRGFGAVHARRHRVRLQGRSLAAAHLAPGGASRRSQPDLRAPLGAGDQDRDLRPPPGHAPDRPGADDLRRRAPRDRRGERRARSARRPRAARIEAAARVPQHREHRHHPHRRGPRVDGAGGGTPGRGGDRVRRSAPARRQPRAVQVPALPLRGSGREGVPDAADRSAGRSAARHAAHRHFLRDRSSGDLRSPSPERVRQRVPGLHGAARGVCGVPGRRTGRSRLRLRGARLRRRARRRLLRQGVRRGVPRRAAHSRSVGRPRSSRGDGRADAGACGDVRDRRPFWPVAPSRPRRSGPAARWSVPRSDPGPPGAPASPAGRILRHLGLRLRRGHPFHAVHRELVRAPLDRRLPRRAPPAAAPDRGGRALRRDRGRRGTLSGSRRALRARSGAPWLRRGARAAPAGAADAGPVLCPRHLRRPDRAALVEARMRTALHLAILLLFPPLLPGVINRVKAAFAGRRGPPVLQLYFDLWKLLRKGAVYSVTTTWIFRAGPVVTLAALLVAALLLPFGGGLPAPAAFPGDVVLFAYLLGAGRFATVLAALDTGSSFEGMGASREVTFAALAEPALFLSIAGLALARGTLSWTAMLSGQMPAWHLYGPAFAMLIGALILVALAENSRIPFDDPNTHLELTMVHEVMV